MKIFPLREKIYEENAPFPLTYKLKCIIILAVKVCRFGFYGGMLSWRSMKYIL